MSWIDKLKEYAPDIAMAVVTGGATLPALAAKAGGDAVGRDVKTPKDIEAVISGASPETMLKLKQANNDFKLRMKELDNELIHAGYQNTDSARSMYKVNSKDASVIGKSIMSKNLVVVFLLAAINCSVIYYLRDDGVIVGMVSTLIGGIISSLLSERQTVVNFFFGSSMGSKNKVSDEKD